MQNPMDLPDVIALFPLPGALLLPRARLPLHMFEPRYLALIDDAMKTQHRMIGMIQTRQLPGGREDPGRDRGVPLLQSIGCAGRITQLSETDDGRYMITLSGVSRFRLIEEVSGFAPYRRAKIDWAPFGRDRGGPETDPNFDRKPFLASLERYFDTAGLSTDWGSLSEADDELLINALSMLCPFPPEDKQALLEAPSLQTRRETLATLIEFALHSGGQEEERLQ
jgi:Lon protease-like protein